MTTVDEPDTFVAGTSATSIHFTGRGSEYFKIWAVNVALTILTIGIYSAWAKVRRLRYFYGNTSLAGSTFDFHGAPAAILRGRIIALIVVVAYSQSPKISLALYGVVAVLIFFLFPWLYWRSLRFRLGNTSYRGAHFHFEGDLAAAYTILLPPLAIFLLVNVISLLALPHSDAKQVDPAALAKISALYLLALSIWPYYYYRLRAYQHAHAMFGSAKFSYAGRASSFYMLALKMVGLVFLWVLVVGAVVAAIALTVSKFSAAPRLQHLYRSRWLA